MFNLNRKSFPLLRLDLFPQPIELARQLGYAAGRPMRLLAALVGTFLFNLNRKVRPVSRLDLLPQPIELADLFGAF